MQRNPVKEANIDKSNIYNKCSGKLIQIAKYCKKKKKKNWNAQIFSSSNLVLLKLRLCLFV